jgi:hypothetical protein
MRFTLAGHVPGQAAIKLASSAAAVVRSRHDGDLSSAGRRCRAGDRAELQRVKDLGGHRAVDGLCHEADPRPALNSETSSASVTKQVASWDVSRIACQCAVTA